MNIMNPLKRSVWLGFLVATWVIASNEAGAQWHAHPYTYSNGELHQVKQVRFYTKHTGLMSALSLNNRPRVFMTSDGGASWDLLWMADRPKNPNDVRGYSIEFTKPHHAIISTHLSLPPAVVVNMETREVTPMRTVSNDSSDCGGTQFVDVSAFPDGRYLGLACNGFMKADGPEIDWSYQVIEESETPFMIRRGRDSTYLVLASFKGFRSDDGCSTWRREESMWRFQRLSAGTDGSVIGLKSTGMVYSHDDAETFEEASVPPSLDLTLVSHISYQNSGAYTLLSDQGMVLASTDRGVSWDSVFQVNTEEDVVFSASFVGDDSIMVFGGFYYYVNYLTTGVSVYEGAREFPVQLSLSPNPASDRLTVGASQPIDRIDVYSINGSHQLSVAFDGSSKSTHTQLGVSDLMPGPYILVVRSRQGTQSRMLSIVR